MRISGAGTKILKIVWFSLVMISLVLLIIVYLFSLGLNFAIAAWFIVMMYGLPYLLFIRRINVVHVFWREEKIVMDKGEISFEHIISIKRYWFYFYKVKYLTKEKTRASFIFIAPPLYVFFASPSIRLLKKKVQQKQTK